MDRPNWLGKVMSSRLDAPCGPAPASGLVTGLMLASLATAAVGCLRYGFDELAPLPGSVELDAGQAPDLDGASRSRDGAGDGAAGGGGATARNQAGASGAGSRSVDAGGVAAADGAAPTCARPAQTSTIEIAADKVLGGPHADFPLLVSLEADWLRPIESGGSIASSAGYDIHFSADAQDSSPLDHEVELYDGVNGSLVAWVRIPSMTASTKLYVQYGDCTIDATRENPAGVWLNYGGVWHLRNDRDSSANANHVTDEGTAGMTPAKIADGVAFDGVSGDLNAGAEPTSLNDVFSDGGVVSAWINANGPGEGQLARIVSKAQPSTPTDFGWSFFMDPTGAGSVMFRHSFSGTAGHWSAAIGAANYGQWHAVAVQYRNATAAEVPTFFIDGQASGGGMYQQDPSGTADSDANSDLRIGNLADGTRTFDGIIDEVRISRGTRTPEWFATEYNNQNDPTHFYTVNSP